MAVFATHVALMRDFQAVSFSPGDELPDWAEKLVGAHCLEPEPDYEEDSGDGGAEADGVGDAGPDADADDAEAEDAAPAAEAAPDFTGAAPAPRRGRPRKQ